MSDYIQTIIDIDDIKSATETVDDGCKLKQSYWFPCSEGFGVTIDIRALRELPKIDWPDFETVFPAKDDGVDIPCGTVELGVSCNNVMQDGCAWFTLYGPDEIVMNGEGTIAEIVNYGDTGDDCPYQQAMIKAGENDDESDKEALRDFYIACTTAIDELMQAR